MTQNGGPKSCWTVPLRRRQGFAPLDVITLMGELSRAEEGAALLLHLYHLHEGALGG